MAYEECKHYLILRARLNELKIDKPQVKKSGNNNNKSNNASVESKLETSCVNSDVAPSANTNAGDDDNHNINVTFKIITS